MKFLKLLVITALIMVGSTWFRTINANSFGNHVVSCSYSTNGNFVLGTYLALVRTSSGEEYFTRVYASACYQ